MPKRNKEKVYESYEEIVQWFDDARTKTLMESEYLNLIVKSVPAGVDSFRFFLLGQSLKYHPAYLTCHRKAARWVL